jgi:ketosteroid isomerase-like protein
MKFVLALAAITFVALQNPPVRESTFKTAKEFDAADVAAIRKMRDQWVASYAAGNATPVEFMFTSDAVFALPAHPSLAGKEPAPSARQVFDQFAAKLAFEEESERFVTDGGDPRKMKKLPWVSYYASYTLTLTPNTGGGAIQSRGQFMTRFHRQADGSLRVIRGPRHGDRAPDFTLNKMKGGGQVQLSSLRGKPVVLIFGSYT